MLCCYLDVQWLNMNAFLLKRKELLRIENPSKVSLADIFLRRQIKGPTKTIAQLRGANSFAKPIDEILIALHDSLEKKNKLLKRSADFAINLESSKCDWVLS